MTPPCALCGSYGCKHSLLERLYGISRMARDEMDEKREREQERFDREAEEDLQRQERVDER